MPIFCTLTDNGDGTATLDVCPDYTSAGAYPGIVIKVTDNGTPAKTDSETITITVYNVNRPPVANAGNDFSVQVATTATLNGSSSFDPDGNLITYNWTFNSIPPGSGLTNALIVNPAQPNASFTPDVEGSYVLELLVSNGMSSDTDNVMVVAAAPAAMRNVDELVRIHFSRHKHKLDRETRMITSTADRKEQNRLSTGTSKTKHKQLTGTATRPFLSL